MRDLCAGEHRLSSARRVATRLPKRRGCCSRSSQGSAARVRGHQVKSSINELTDAEIAAALARGKAARLHWETLDIDLSVADLLVGPFGAKAYMARHAGRLPRQERASAQVGAGLGVIVVLPPLVLFWGATSTFQSL